jgi:hypothetical protein
MTDSEKIKNTIYEFILFELTRRENALSISRGAYYTNKSHQNNFAVIEEWVKLEYFRKIAGDLEELLKYVGKE